MSSEKELEEAVHMLETVPESKLKQVLALQWFERSLNNMYLHRYEKCSEAFLKMIELNKVRMWAMTPWFWADTSSLEIPGICCRFREGPGPTGPAGLSAP